jgi:hypothetical protein
MRERLVKTSEEGSETSKKGLLKYQIMLFDTSEEGLV